MDVLLTVVSGPRAGLEFRAKGKTVVTVGRSKTTDFHILDESMSRVHVVVAKDDSGWYVADQKSRNGLWRGDERVDRIRLADGGVFRMGAETAIRFDLVDEEREAAKASIVVTLECARCGRPIEGAGDVVRVPDGRPFHVGCRDLEHLVGADIGGFKVTETLPPSRGAFFFRAHQPTLNRTVVLEVFDPPLTAKPGFKEALLAEVRRASRFLHPNVLQIFDYGEARGMCFVVMEPFVGSPLSEVLAERRFVKIKEAVTVAAQLAEALQYAREQGGIEPWISASSVLVAADHETKARLFREPTPTAQAVQPSDAPYVAPEILTGEGKGHDANATVYSIGAVLYHMLAGIPPFEGATVEDVARRAKKDTPPALRRINMKVSPALAQIVETAIDRRPDHRPASIGAFRDALKKAVAPPVTR